MMKRYKLILMLAAFTLFSGCTIFMSKKERMLQSLQETKWVITTFNKSVKYEGAKLVETDKKFEAIETMKFNDNYEVIINEDKDNPENYVITKEDGEDILLVSHYRFNIISLDKQFLILTYKSGDLLFNFSYRPELE